jgi:hypothetical protein
MKFYSTLLPAEIPSYLLKKIRVGKTALERLFVTKIMRKMRSC